MTYERKSMCVAQIDAPKQNMTPRLPFNHSVLLRVQKRVANRLPSDMSSALHCQVVRSWSTTQPYVLE